MLPLPIYFKSNSLSRKQPSPESNIRKILPAPYLRRQFHFLSPKYSYVIPCKYERGYFQVTHRVPTTEYQKNLRGFSKFGLELFLYMYAGSNIRVGSPGNFEAELRLPRQN